MIAYTPKGYKCTKNNANYLAELKILRIFAPSFKHP
jgi:hypothetical protein